MSLAPLSSLVKSAAVAGLGAFLGALGSLQAIPTTWAAARPILASAFATAVLAEIVFLRQQLTGILAGTVVPPPPAPPRTILVTPTPKDPSP